MIRTRFLITTAEGRRFIGPVHGSGGTIEGRDALKRLLVAQEQATAGEEIRAVYEPKPGHVLMHVGACALSDGVRTEVPLVGATIVKLKERESKTVSQMMETNARRYAAKYVADDGPPECTDEDIARVLAGCVMKPHAEHYPSIRTAVYDLVTEGGRRKP